MPPVTTYMLMTQVLPALVGAIVLVVVALRIHSGRQRKAEPLPPRPRTDLEEHMAVVAEVSGPDEAEALAKQLIAQGIPALPKVEVIGVEYERRSHVPEEVLRTTVVVPVVDLERARELVDASQQPEGDATEKQVEQDLEREGDVAPSTDEDVEADVRTLEGGRIVSVARVPREPGPTASQSGDTRQPRPVRWAVVVSLLEANMRVANYVIVLLDETGRILEWYPFGSVQAAIDETGTLLHVPASSWSTCDITLPDGDSIDPGLFRTVGG